MRRRLLLAVLLLGLTSFAGASGCSDPTGACIPDGELCVKGDTCCNGPCRATDLLGDFCNR
jgi:hypothetical protein